MNAEKTLARGREFALVATDASLVMFLQQMKPTASPRMRPVNIVMLNGSPRRKKFNEPMRIPVNIATQIEIILV